MKLEPATTSFEPVNDRRPKMFDPPPVRLVGVNDLVLPSIAGIERQLDRFYAELLAFDREEGEAIVYRAENFRLRFELIERPEPREDYRAVGVEVPSFADLIPRLIEAEVEFARQRGLFAGQESLLVQDPAGNLLELFEMKRIL